MLCLKMIFGSQRCEAPDLPSSSSSSNERLFPPPPGVILDAPPPPEGAPILAASYKLEEKLLVKRENRKTEGFFKQYLSGTFQCLLKGGRCHARLAVLVHLHRLSLARRFLAGGAGAGGTLNGSALNRSGNAAVVACLGSLLQ